MVESLLVTWAGFSALGLALGALVGGPTLRARAAWSLTGLLFWPALLVLLVRHARAPRGEDAGGAAPRGPRVPVPVPSAAALEDVPEPVRACPDCGFLGIRPAGVQDGAWAGGGELVASACPRCGHHGPAIEFAKREEYRAFLESLPRAA